MPPKVEKEADTTVGTNPAPTVEDAKKEAAEGRKGIKDSMEASGEKDFSEFDTGPTRVGNQYGVSEKAQLNELDRLLAEARAKKAEAEELEKQANELAKELNLNVDNNLRRTQTKEEKEAQQEAEKADKEAEKTVKAEIQAEETNP